MDQSNYELEPRGSSGWMLGFIQLAFVIGVIATAIGMTQVLKGQVNDRAPRIADLRGASEVTVRIADIELSRYAPTVRVNGTVQATAEVSVSPQVSGEIRVVSSAFRAGSEVQKGDLLFEIDRADYVLAVQRAESEIAAASSDLQQLEAEARIAIQEWKELYPGREVNDLAARVPQIEAAKARLASAEANKRTSELSLTRTRVYASTNARVLASSLDIGQIVSPGQVLGRLVSLDSIELAVPVSSDDLSILEPIENRLATFQRRGIASEQRTATIGRIDATLDPRTRLSNLYLIPDDRSGLRIGDFVDVTIAADAVEGAITLPATALTGQSGIWVVENQALAARTIKVLGEADSGNSIIVAPFDMADGVVALPPLEAEQGQPVGIRGQAGVVVADGGRADAAE
ncbi:MAG: efflux RND transporter periplasmic adaptor subunit [Pseudomonadota bacterium]